MESDDSQTRVVTSSPVLGGPRSPDRSPARVLPRGATIDRYVILDVLGRGGMGVVYAAYDPELDRSIALKLLRTEKLQPDDVSHGRSRLLREARALAKLSHPNVITIYDVGLFENDVYLAMEMASGQTLRSWLNEKTRSWQEIVSVYVEAGRGLAAAHDAGLIHRDFKPSNVLVSSDGRVRVLDFGLARAATLDEEITDPADPTSSDISPARPRAPLESISSEISDISSVNGNNPLTQTGMLIGTPFYMAPEIALGNPANPRSDQFSFCVTLYEGLYGVRPFSGKNRKQILHAILDRDLTTPTHPRDVPPWLHRVVLRGLANRPEDRWQSMDELILQLQHDPARTRRRWSSIAAVFALGVTSAYAIASLGPEQPVCSDGSEDLAGVWAPARKRAIASQFRASSLEYAGDSWQRVEDTLDDYTERWSKMHREACEATHVRHEQSETLLDLRMTCLDSRLHELRGLVNVLAEADAKVVRNSVQAANSLSPIEECADLERLQSDVPPPESREQQVAVDRIREQLAEVRALDLAGRYDDALELARTLAGEVELADYPPVRAEVLHRLGRLLYRTGDFESARETLAESAWIAHAHGHDEYAARSESELIHVVGYRLADFDTALLWARHADATSQRLGRPEDIEADRHNSLAVMYLAKEELENAANHWEKALEYRIRAVGPEHFNVGAQLSNLGIVAYQQEQHEQAIDYNKKAIDLWERTLGPNHVHISKALNNMALSEMELDRWEDASQHLTRALALIERTLGPEHPNVSEIFNNLGTIAEHEGDLDRALQLYRKALKLRKAVYDADHPQIGSSLLNIGKVLLAQDQIEQAEQPIMKAQSMLENKLGPEHALLGQAYEAVGSLHAARNEHARAVGALRRALELREASLGPDNSRLTELRIRLGASLVEVGQSAEAIGVLEQALRSPNAGSGAKTEALARFSLARALQSSGGDMERALELARQSKQMFSASQQPQQRRRVMQWLRRHSS